MSPRSKTSDGVRITNTNGDQMEVEAVMFATGRAPNTAGLISEDVAVALGAKGEIMVDAYSQSSVPSIYALGDVTDRVNLTPVAIREAMCFIDTVFRGQPTWSTTN